MKKNGLFKCVIREFLFATTDGPARVGSFQLNAVVFSSMQIHPKYCRRNCGTTLLNHDACADDAKMLSLPLQDHPSSKAKAPLDREMLVSVVFVE